MNNRFVAALLLGAATVTLGPVACTTTADQPAQAQPSGAELGMQTEWMDASVDPGDDFFGYANGAWYERTEIPADRSNVGGFYIANQQTEENLQALISEIRRGNPAPGSDAARVKAFYESFLDTGAIEAAGLQPVQADLSRFAAISDKRQLARVLGQQTRADVDPLNLTNFWTENLFGVFVTQALKGGQVVPYILQGGLGLPEREYYLSSDPKMAEVRKAYRQYLVDFLKAAEVADAEVRAKRIYDLELKIAQAHATRQDSDDWAAASSLWSRADFGQRAPGMDWDAFFGGAQLAEFETFDAYHPKAIAGLSSLVKSEPLDAWKDWLLFHQLNQHAAVLPSRLDELSFAFYGKTLFGTEAQRPRDRRALDAVNEHMGDALGRLYVEKYFPAADKASIQVMVDNIKSAFVSRIDALEWMNPTTKAEAKKKVRTMEVGVGYPDAWTDYSLLSVKPESAYANVNAADQLYYRQQIAKVGKPLDKREWWMNTQLVNAVNLPVQNALNFPAAILQPPFYDPDADAAFNYGAIGAVIGHEITHSFDDNGAEFDSGGVMRNWWTDADKAQFKQAGAALSAQYDKYEPLPGLTVKGVLTLGENIADLAGLQAAYDAYRKSLGGREAPVIGGFTGDQRFFIAYAQAWATKMREAALRQRIATDGHSPGQYRALTVRNMDEWYKAFDVRPDDTLYLPPEKRVKVW